MNLEKLIESGKDRTDVENIQKRLKYFNFLYSKYNPSPYDSLINLNFGELFGLVLLVNSNDTSVEEVKNIINELNKYCNDCVNNDLSSFLNSIFPAFTKLKAIDDVSDINIQAIPLDHNGIGSINKHKPFIDILLKYIKFDKQIVIDWINLVFLKESQRRVKEKIKEMKPKDKNKFLNYFFERIKNVSNYSETLEKLQKYSGETNKNIHKKLKTIAIYEEIDKKIKSGDGIKDYDSSWKNLPLEVQCCLMEKILQEQLKKYEQLTEEENNLNKESEPHKLLTKFGIHPSLIMDIESLDLKLEHLTELLTLFQQNRFPIQTITNKECLYNLLKLNKNAAETIISYYKTSAVTREFLDAHPHILEVQTEDNPNGLKELVDENYQLLKEENVSFSSKNYDPSILLLPTDELKERIALIKEYGFSLTNNNVLNLLKNTDLFDLVDFSLEHQLPVNEIIKFEGNREDISNMMKRLIIAENFGLDILTQDDEFSHNILTPNSFLIPQRCLDEVIENATPHFIDTQMERILGDKPRISIKRCPLLLPDIDNLYLDEEGEIYNFNGTYISRNKILRNYSALKLELPAEDDKDLLYQSMIYHTILSHQQLDNIKRCLYKVKQKTYKE